MDDDIFRIMISTDNHLGFQDKSPVRHTDSFAAFEEVLRTANEEHADFVLLAGDLFHENKPSRRTVVNTMDVLRRHCTGSNPVYMEIISNQEEIFKNTSLKRVNYEDPNHSISMPVFAIHGNHDDPSRDGIGDPLAALDFFSVSNLINYVGKHEQVDDIEVTPILMRKGRTTIALYPLGAVRDERLNRMWTNKKVKFLKPSSDLGLGTIINIFVLHQNRDYGRGRKNCVHETMIPEWMDVVVWGNEHECIPSMVESLAGTFRIYQPGSSVATSLSEGESSRYPKHMGLLEVYVEKFRLRPIPFRQVRPFVYGDLALSSIDDLDARSNRLEETVLEVLTGHVKQLIRQARALITDELRNHSSSDANFVIHEPHKVIIRLRVDYTGFPMNCLNLQRFGTKFLDDVANPSDVILFAKRKAEGQKATATSGHSTAFQNEFTAWLEGDKEAVNKIKVEDLVCDALTNQQKQLGLLAPESLSLALEDFVIRKVPSAINDVVEETLDNTQKLLRKDPTTIHKDDIQAAAMKAKDMNSTSGRGSTQSSTKSPSSALAITTDKVVKDSKVKPRSNTAATSTRKKALSSIDNDSVGGISSDENDIAGPKGRQKRGRADAGKSQTRAPPTKKTKVIASTPTTSTRPSRAKKKPIVYVESDEDLSRGSGEHSDALDDMEFGEDDDLFNSSDEEKKSSCKKKGTQASKAQVSSRSGRPTSGSKKAATTSKIKSKNSINITSDESSDEVQTPVPKGSGKARGGQSTSKQQKLTLSSRGAGSTTSSNRGNRRKNTSSAMDEW